MFFPDSANFRPEVSVHRSKRGGVRRWICVDLAGLRVLMTTDEAIALTNQLADTVEQFDKPKTHGKEQQNA